MENLNNEFDEIELEAEEITTESERTGSGIGGKLLIGGVIAAVGLGIAAVVKSKDKIEAAKIKRWEKKGYVVMKAEDVEIREVDVEEDDEDSDEE